MDFASKHNIKVKIFINSLEETKSKVVSTLIAGYIYKTYGIEMDYYKILNYQISKGLNSMELTLVEEGSKWVDKHYECVEILHISTPRLYYNHIMNYMSTIGTFYNTSSGSRVKVPFNKEWDLYEYNEPTIVVSIFDTIDKCSPSILHGEKSIYDAAKNYSAVLSRQRMCMGCGIISVIVQQQSPLAERVETTTGGVRIIEKSKPNLSYLNVCKATSEDCTLALGVFNPARIGVTKYLGYVDITDLKEGKFRSLSILKCREGTPEYPNNEIPLCCKFGIDKVEELPLPTDTVKMKLFFNS